ncbi:MAG: hypothetical protein BYD32DRAFT_413942 [Podila humilis]|nr:MAG: hypothetical protein BYD32DRAFT_413942 [Podila humilis]
MPPPVYDDFHIHTLAHSPHTEPDPRVGRPPPDYAQNLTAPDTQEHHASISHDEQYTLYSPLSPHTQPDPRVDCPPPDCSQILTTTDTQPDSPVSISQDAHCTLSPLHSPHTQPDPRVQAPPIYSLPVPSLLELLNLPLDSSPPHNPHTVPVQFISPNPNPQSGEAQLDFIPLPVSSPSAPSEQSLMIPDADDDAKYETQDFDRRPSCSTLASTIPDASNDAKYEMEDNSNQSPSLSSSSTSTLVRSVTSLPDTLAPQDDEKADIKKMSAAKGSIMDIDFGKYEVNFSEAEKGVFVRRLQNQRTKIFWIASLVALAIMFGALGATIWRPNQNTSSPGHNTSMVPPGNNSTTNTNNGTVSTNNSTISTNSGNSNSNATDADWVICTNKCSPMTNICDAGCRATDVAYQSCAAKCSSTDTDCEFDCQKVAPCFMQCIDEWGKCAQDCSSLCSGNCSSTNGTLNKPP